MCLLALLFALSLTSNGVYGTKTSNEELLEVATKLKLLNKPAIKSIQSEDGDIIDCVDIYKQPAFDHPALKNHTIQMEPSFFPKTNLTTTKKNESTTPVLLQLWRKNGSCPNGTIPIRRIRKEDLIRAKAIERFGRKNPYIIRSSNRTEVTKYGDNAPDLNRTVSNVLQVNRSVAYLITQGYNYLGAFGEINVWNPYIESNDDYSTAQIWLLGGPGDNFDSIESGWMVNPSFYGDKRTRFFVYWTVDASRSTGCFDLTCSGFVQTSQEVGLGSALEPVSSERGNQYEISVNIYMDVNTTNWWLYFGETKVGYWPGSIFRYLSHSATLVHWGGEVYSPTIGRAGVPHTATAMGAGNPAQNMYGSACYIHHVRILDWSLFIKYPEWAHAYADEPYCYSALNYVQYIKEPEFYFGGAGRDPYYCR